MAISFVDPEAVASILGKVATSTLKALKYVNDLTGKLDPAQWTFSLTTKGIGLVKNSAGKIFASVKDGKFTCQVLKDGASTTLEEDVKNVILEKNDQGKLVAKTEKGNFEVEEGKGAEEGDLTIGSGYLDNLSRYQQLFKEGKISELFSELKKTNAFPKMGETRIRSLTDMEKEYFTKYGEKAKNYPYSKINPVTDFKLEEIGYFVRVYSGESTASSWIFRIEDLRSYKSVDEIVEKLALPSRPTKVGLVEVPPGTDLRKSTAGPQNWTNGIKEEGGGIQYEIRSTYNKNWFQELSSLEDFLK